MSLILKAKNKSIVSANSPALRLSVKVFRFSMSSHCCPVNLLKWTFRHFLTRKFLKLLMPVFVISKIEFKSKNY
jgi:hypothetical protein